MPTLLILAAMIGAFLGIGWGVKPPPHIYPERALAYAREHGLTAGNVYNHYDFGGFLIGNGVPTFIDGRGVPFGDMLDEYFFPSDERFRAAIDRYGVTWALMRPGMDAPFERMGWRKEYEDDVSVIYARP